MNDSILVVVLASAVVYGTPLLYAALGELLAERSGVLNLGVEGMMLVGAVMGFWAVQRGRGRAVVARGGRRPALAGASMALIHAFLVVTLRANQIVSGLALTIFAGAIGLSSYLGNDLELADQPAQHPFHRCLLLADVPVVGPILFDQTALVYPRGSASSRRAVPRPHAARPERPRGRRVAGSGRRDGHQRRALPLRAHAGRRRVRGRRRRLLLARDHAAVGRRPDRGAGWIAIALVIFAFWRPALCLVGAYLFGAFSGVPFTFQARGILKASHPSSSRRCRT